MRGKAPPAYASKSPGLLGGLTIKCARVESVVFVVVRVPEYVIVNVPPVPLAVYVLFERFKSVPVIVMDPFVPVLVTFDVVEVAIVIAPPAPVLPPVPPLEITVPFIVEVEIETAPPAPPAPDPLVPPLASIAPMVEVAIVTDPPAPPAVLPDPLFPDTFIPPPPPAPPKLVKVIF
jgi:hypothetical protein